jgi:hypothetical protein
MLTLMPFRMANGIGYQLPGRGVNDPTTVGVKVREVFASNTAIVAPVAEETKIPSIAHGNLQTSWLTLELM